MNNREDFEKWRSEHTDMSVDMIYQAWQEATTRAQKIIDELKAKNPDVPCPACEGEKKIIMGRNITDTGWCYDNCCYCNGKGSVSTVKALQYENEQLENKIKTMQDSAQKLLDILGGVV